MTLDDWRAHVRAHLPPLALAREPEILDELAQHLADLHADAIAGGHSEDEAVATALAALPRNGDDLARHLLHASRALPGVILDRWVSADPPAPPARRVPFFADFARDLVHGARALLHTPGFTAVVVTTLALGIGANSAIFAAVDAVLLRPLPYAHADRLVVPVSVNVAREIDNGSITFADYMEWRGHTDIFDAVALWRSSQADIVGGAGDPERILGAQVSEEYFRLIDTPVLAGRGFVAADHAADAAHVTVLAHGLWQRRFGGDRGAIGRTLRIAGVPHEIVGVLPPRVIWPDNAALFTPIRPALVGADTRTRRDDMTFLAVARLRETTTIDQGDAVLGAIAARLEQEFPGSRAGWTNRLVPLREWMVGDDLRRALLVLLAAVAAVLLIGCANVAHLGLVRGLGRAREIGVRLALGASRWRVVRQLAAESLVLAAAGGLAGTALAAWMIQGLKAIAPAGTPLVDHIALDVRILGAIAVFATAAVLLSGLLPALASSRVQLGSALKDGSPGAGSSRRAAFLRQGLVVAEVATAVILLTAAGLLIRSFARVQQIDPGVDVDRVLVGRVSLPSSRYSTAQARVDFYQRLIDRLRATPGIDAAAATSFVPVGGGGFGLGRVFLAEGWAEPPAGRDVAAQWNVVTPEYFETVGIPVLQGRTFTDADRAGSTPVAIVTASFARQMFGDENPLGKRARSWRDENILREIVGVVADVRYWALTDRERPLVYVPHTQNSWGSLAIALRSAGPPPAAFEQTLRRETTALDGELAISNIAPLASLAADSVAQERYTTLLLSLLATTALALSAIGIYGVISHAASLRRREFGIRTALGAPRHHVYALVFRQGLGLTALGLAIGTAGAFSVSAALETLLYQTTGTEPIAYVVTVATLAIVAVCASLLPARRAAQADPLASLRQL